MKIHYCYDKFGKYICSKPSRLSPLDKEEVYLLPANATFVKPPNFEDTNKTPYFDKKNKKWFLKDDDEYKNHFTDLENIEKRKKQKEIEKKLNIKDEFGVFLYKRKGDDVIKINDKEYKEQRLQVVKSLSEIKYFQLKKKFVELASYCYVSNNMNAKDKIKLFKDNIDQVWNSIDGTKKPEEIIWPEIPEI